MNKYRRPAAKLAESRVVREVLGEIVGGPITIEYATALVERLRDYHRQSWARKMLEAMEAKP